MIVYNVNGLNFGSLKKKKNSNRFFGDSIAVPLASESGCSATRLFEQLDVYLLLHALTISPLSLHMTYIDYGVYFRPGLSLLARLFYIFLITSFYE